MTNLIVAITGHRPEKIADPEWVHEALKEVLLELKPVKLIQGMAAGVDMMSATVAHEIGLPYLSARPWAGHTPRYDDKELYRVTLENSAEIVDVSLSEKYLGPWLYQERNKYMVDNGNMVVAIWDGTKGGTKNCVDYALRLNRPITIINPKKQTITYPEGFGPQTVEPSPEEQGFLF